MCRVNSSGKWGWNFWIEKKKGKGHWERIRGGEDQWVRFRSYSTATREGKRIHPPGSLLCVLMSSHFKYLLLVLNAKLYYPLSLLTSSRMRRQGDHSKSKNIFCLLSVCLSSRSFLLVTSCSRFGFLIPFYFDSSLAPFPFPFTPIPSFCCNYVNYNDIFSPSRFPLIIDSRFH